MNIENKIFKKHVPDYNKIIKYGFIEEEDKYVFQTKFFNNEFLAKVEILKEGEITGTVYDTENNEEYLPLRLENQQGAFVGEVRTEYERVLQNICDCCFLKNQFIYQQTNRISNLILNKYNDTPHFMWEKFPNFGVFKISDNNKWYAAIMNIDRSKLDASQKGEVEIINVKLDKNKIPKLVKQMGFYPAWHMNKKSWITILLDDTLSDEVVMKYIDESYRYAVGKK